MKRKKLVVFIFLFVLVFGVILIPYLIKKNKNLEKNESANITLESHYGVEEENGEYVLYNEYGDEIVRSEDRGALEIYIRDPDYNPQIPIKESGLETKNDDGYDENVIFISE